MSEAPTTPSWHPIEDLDPAAVTSRPMRCRAGGQHIVIVRTAEGVRAMERACPHQQAALTDAILMGGNLRCPKHNFIFRLSDGKGINCTGLFLKVYPVREVAGRVEVEL